VSGLLLVLGGCSRNSATGADAAADGALVSTAPDAAPPTASVTDAGVALASVAPIEARRARVRRWAEDGALEGAAPLLDKHFGAGLASFEIQTADLTAAGRRIVFVTDADKPPNEEHPFAFVADAHGVLWSKERPIAGILPPAGPSAIAPAPLGRVALAVCDAPTNAVALRIWDDDGSPFADFQVLSVEKGCDALSLLYWPRRGWVIVASQVGATRVQLANENGGPMWPQGKDLGARSPRPGAIARASLAADTDDTFVLVQMVQPSAVEGSPYHTLAFRYDTHGTAIWPAAVDLGAVPRPPAPGDRVKLSLTKPGVRVTLPDGSEIDVRPSGDVTPGGGSRGSAAGGTRDVIPRARAPR
jgi:hypothetical protein